MPMPLTIPFIAAKDALLSKYKRKICRLKPIIPINLKKQIWRNIDSGFDNQATLNNDLYGIDGWICTQNA